MNAYALNLFTECTILCFAGQPFIMMKFFPTFCIAHCEKKIVFFFFKLFSRKNFSIYLSHYIVQAECVITNDFIIFVIKSCNLYSVTNLCPKGKVYCITYSYGDLL